MPKRPTECNNPHYGGIGAAHHDGSLNGKHKFEFKESKTALKPFGTVLIIFNKSV